MWTLASLEPESIKYILIFGVGGAIAIVTIVSSALRSILVGRAREQTKRELAAYVAEGTLDPDKAVAMINAGKSSDETDRKGACGCA